MKQLPGFFVLLLPLAAILPTYAQMSRVEGLQIRQIKYNAGDSIAEVDLYNAGAAPVAAYGLSTYAIFADGAEHLQFLMGDLTNLIMLRKMFPDMKSTNGSLISGSGPGEHFPAEAPVQSSSPDHGPTVGFRAEATFVIFTDGTASSDGQEASKRDIAHQRAAWKREAQALDQWLPEVKRVLWGSSKATAGDMAGLIQRLHGAGVTDGVLGEMARTMRFPESLPSETPLGSDPTTMAFWDRWMKALDERALLLGTLGGK
jgi:hypothetical protein